MHIAFVTHAFPRWKGDISGTFIERLAAAIVARGHRVTVVAPADRGRGGPERRGGVDVQWVRYGPAEQESLAHTGIMVEGASTVGGKVLATSLILALARPLRRMLRNQAVDVVHAHWWIPGGVATWLACRGANRPYVVTLHGTDVRLLEHSRLLRATGRRVMRRARAVTAVSVYLAEQAASVMGTSAENILVQPMPADLIRLSRGSRGGGGIVTVGRLVPQKRIDLVLDAVAHMHRRGRAVRLTVIGEGPLRSALEERAARLGIAPSTRFLGQVPPEHLAHAIGNADAFAFAAYGEGLGLAAVEAFILGVPVAVTDAGGGVKDVVPTSGAGRVVPEGDAAALGEALIDLMDATDARQRAAETGQLLRARFDPDRVAATFESVYERVSTRPS